MNEEQPLNPTVKYCIIAKRSFYRRIEDNCFIQLTMNCKGDLMVHLES